MKFSFPVTNRLIQIIFFSLAVFLPVSVYADEFAKGLLWEISGKGAQPSYILGTIHSDDERVTAIPEPVQTAMHKVRSFTAELDLNFAAMLEAQTHMLLPQGQELKDLIGTQRYDVTVKIMNQYGVPEAMVAHMKPWAVSTQLMMPKPTTGIFLDLVLYQSAQSRGLKTYGLETAMEQVSAFDKLDQKQQVSLLDQALREYKDLPAMFQRMISLYLARDLAGLQRYSEEQMQTSDPQLARSMEKHLITDRNTRMVERMQVRLQEGDAFIAVGALHLPGEHGILRLLQNRGYRLKALY